ncbi:hypothetical protein ACP70R_003220 [Stipagrostis hirtigluma subsp. patula]
MTHVLHKQLVSNCLLVDTRKEVHRSIQRVLCQVDLKDMSIDFPITIHPCHRCRLQLH